MSKIKNYRLPDEVIKQFVEWSSGFFSSDEFDRIILSFEHELNKYHVTRENESNLLRILNAIIDKVPFLSGCIKYPHYLETICSISVNSNYLTDILVRNPEALYLVLSNEYLESKITLDSILKEINKSLSHFKGFETRINILRSLKRRYILKIALNDIRDYYSLEEVVEYLSILAVALNRSLFMLCYSEVADSLGLESLSKKFALMSLGKLGGNELNYSSDIDLLMIYDSNELIGKNENIEYHEMLIKTINLYISKATEFTELGNLYRVDFRLRPDGGVAPLCRTLLDTMNYYESRGEQWERQMLLKLNFLAGDEELFKQFNSFVKAYVYQVSNILPFNAIREMKEAIEKHHSDINNIKTSVGGIRDIEFTVQALQLINGKRFKDLRISNTLQALKILRRNKLLTKDESDKLREAYILYRKIEHYLQLMNNTQTHTIPGSIDSRKSLAVYMKSGSEKELLKLINHHKKNVRTIYNSIVSESPSGKIKHPQPDQISFHDPKRSERDLKFLEFGTGLVSIKNFDSRTTKQFLSIKPTLFKLLKEMYNPDHVLENFVKLVQSYKFTILLYEELEKEKFFRQILRICERSNLAINQQINQPQLVEDLLSRSAFAKNLQEDIDTTTFDRFKFALAIQFSLNLIDHKKVSRYIGMYITYVLETNFENFFDKYTLFVAGLGSYGSMEMTFFSDLDLIIVVDDINSHPEVHDAAQKYLKKIQEVLHPLEIDFRLRPEGKSSPLVWDIENYSNYLDNRAGVWEYQSLFKMRRSAGSAELFDRFRKIVIDKLRQMDAEYICKEIIEMHRKVTTQMSSGFSKNIDLKKVPGGLTTIDYYLSYHQLTNKDYHKYAGKPNYSKQLIIRKSNGILPAFQMIKNNYDHLKELEFILQNSFKQRKAIIPIDKMKQGLLVKFMNAKDLKTFNETLFKIMKENLALLKSIGY